MFEANLGVTPLKLEEAVRECFASKFDYRVYRYTAATNASSKATVNGGANPAKSGGGGNSVQSRTWLEIYLDELFQRVMPSLTHENGLIISH